MIALFEHRDSMFERLRTLHNVGFVGDSLLNTLQVILLDVLVDSGVLLGIQEGGVLLDLLFKPFPNLAFEVRLTTHT